IRVPSHFEERHRIGIIGGGFSGMLTAVQLIRNCDRPIEIIVFNERGTLAKGIAYDPYSRRHLLNVTTRRMSAFSDRPDDFLDHVMATPEFMRKDRSLIADSFLPRAIYGEYLVQVWKDALDLAHRKKVSVQVVEDLVQDLDVEEDLHILRTAASGAIAVESCVIATGNHFPRDPKIRNIGFYPDARYFRDPWKMDSVQGATDDLPVLIIGNGLTMVDTVLGLLEQGYKGKIHSISPHGFSILPHRHTGFKYTQLTDELPLKFGLADLVRLVNKHVKAVREYGITAEPVIDSLRPFTQQIWKGLTREERMMFMSRLRHLWGVARHRIPLNTYDRIQQLRIEGRLKVSSGTLSDLTAHADHVLVEYFDRKDRQEKEMKVSRIINCTGPETNFMQLQKSFLKNCLQKGILVQDELKLGLRANTTTYQVINAKGDVQQELYTLGSNLRSELWESTAVNELRDQAAKVADQILFGQKKAEAASLLRSGK
ncbi:MAG: FAD/NAD(P)-binding protein, partial [Bacteroidota bacterium]|nr:FAD/NAD(P)-binding protein [Bacteroidota bacterium]